MEQERRTTTTRGVACNGIEMLVSETGAGAPIVLLHGWPHTHALWSAVIDALGDGYRAIAPDLRGIGASTRTATGYDLQTLAGDVASLIDALDARAATLVAIDAAVAIAWMLAMRRPASIANLVLVEGLVGTLPGAEAFFAMGRPWWFAFHEIPGLAERVVAGNEDAYLDYFYTIGSKRGIAPELRDAFVAAYRGSEALRCGFAYYRDTALRAEQIDAALRDGRLRVPTLAIGAAAVGNALYRQLLPLADDVIGESIETSGHIVPIDEPERLADAIRRFRALRTRA